MSPLFRGFYRYVAKILCHKPKSVPEPKPISPPKLRGGSHGIFRHSGETAMTKSNGGLRGSKATRGRR